jgi:hypothetical protein
MAGAAVNPFAKSVMASPSKRERSSVLDKLVGASPPAKSLLSRASTFAEEGMSSRTRKRVHAVRSDSVVWFD